MLATASLPPQRVPFPQLSINGKYKQIVIITITIGAFLIFVCNEVTPIHAVFQKSHGNKVFCAAKLNGIETITILLFLLL
tara:strand:- start:12785 stop:13024 length:240 start_codon:yes stop_codon:yes gene_type:complete